MLQLYKLPLHMVIWLSWNVDVYQILLSQASLKGKMNVKMRIRYKIFVMFMLLKRESV